jgi:hypothetical protein
MSDVGMLAPHSPQTPRPSLFPLFQTWFLLLVADLLGLFVGLLVDYLGDSPATCIRELHDEAKELWFATRG